MPTPAAFLFAYFRGEATADGEQVYFAVSSPQDPLTFEELNGGKPVLVSARGVRDPFLIRNELDGGFHLLATDLQVFPGHDWSAALRHGSQDVILWDSPDLCRWSGPRSVTVSPPSSGCTWAPEAVLDRQAGEYVVVWASTRYDDDGDPQRERESHLRVLSSRTRDFRTFTAAQTYFDPGYSVIDTTFLDHNGALYRITKDERERSSAAPNGKHVFQERSEEGVFGKFRPVAEGIGSSVLDQGEGPILAEHPDGRSWILLVDEFSGRGYTAFRTSHLDSGVWTPDYGARLPAGARHGSLLGITVDEREALLRAFGSR